MASDKPIPADMKRQCDKCFVAGAEPLGGKQPIVMWWFNRMGKYALKAICANCRDPLGAVGRNSPLAKLAPPKPAERPTLFDKDEYLVKRTDSAGDK